MGMEKQFAVIFDMDGVLVENSDVHNKAWQMIFKKYGKNISAEKIKDIFGGSNKVFVSKFLNSNSADEIKVIAAEKEALYREIFKKDIRVPDGLLIFLKDLKKNDIPSAVATSAPTENLDFVLDKLDIRQYFDVLIDESSIINGKPDPEIYLTTAKKLNIKPANCLVIEDSIFGIQSALAAGMKVIGITTTFSAEKIKCAHLIINTFKEIDIEKIKSLMNN